MRVNALASSIVVDSVSSVNHVKLFIIIYIQEKLIALQIIIIIIITKLLVV